MEVANVPTMNDLRDPNTYRCESGIPVFRPHVRHVLDINRNPTGKIKYKVTDEDLQEICDNSNAAVDKDCHFPRQTIGHVNFKPIPETDQPARWVGHAVNYRVGMMPNGEKVILADLYTHKDHHEEAKKYPYRSAEYNWKSKRIGGVARLLRDPALGLGTTKYSAASLYEDEDSYTCYAEAVMEPKMGTVPEGMNAGDLNPDEAVMADRLWSYFSAKYPGIAAAAAAVPSGTNTGMPEEDQKPKPEEGEEKEGAKKASENGEQVDDEDDEDEEGDGKAGKKGKKGGPGRSQPPKKKKPSEDSDVSKNSDETVTVEQYAALQGEVETLRKQLADKTAETEKAKVALILDQLEKVEKYEFDRAEVEVEMLAADDAGRTRKAENIRKHNKQKGNETVVVLEGNASTQQLPGASDKRQGMTQAHYDRAIVHFNRNSSKGGTWAEAIEATK